MTTQSDQRIRKNVSLLESVIAKAKELVGDRNLGQHKFSQLLSELILHAHRRRESDEGKTVLQLVAKIDRLEKALEDGKASRQEGWALFESQKEITDRAYKRIKELEDADRDRRLEELRPEKKNSHQAQGQTMLIRLVPNGGFSVRQRRAAPGVVKRVIGRRLRHRSEEHTSELQSRQYLVCR